MELSRVTQASAAEIAAAVRAREITATAVVLAFLERIDRLEPRFNTFVTRTPELALQAAARVDHLVAQGRDPGALAGVPISVKDLIAVGGVRQTFGSLLLADHVPRDDAPSVARLRAAGACIVGKSTTSELGSKGVGDSPLTGVTRNPWDPQRTPGGSSSGAGAQVAARMVPVALATDGGGSIRIPASFCGVFGIKACFGRVPVWPPAAAPSLSHVGPITRTVRDAALVLSVIAGHDARDPDALLAAPPDFLGSLGQGLRGLRIGWCPSFGYGHADPVVVAACERAAQALESHRAVVREVPPLFVRDPAPAWRALFYGRIGERLAQLAPTRERLELVNAALRRAVVQAREDDADPAQIALLQQETISRTQWLWRDIDVLLTPTLPVTALPVGVDVPPGHEDRNAVDWSYFTYPFNLTGNPAASWPVGRDAQGLPIGLQLVAPPDGEPALLRVTAALERMHPVILPPVD